MGCIEIAHALGTRAHNIVATTEINIRQICMLHKRVTIEIFNSVIFEPLNAIYTNPQMLSEPLNVVRPPKV